MTAGGRFRIAGGWVLSLVGLAIFTALPFVEIAAANIAQGISVSRLSSQYVTALQGVLLLGVVLRVMLWSVPFWRIAVALAPVVFLFFSFGTINAGLGLSGGFPPPEISQASPLADRFPVLLLVWLLVLLAVFGVCLYGARDRRALFSVVLIGVALLVEPSWSLFRQREQIVFPSGVAAVQQYLFGAKAADRPNIYWLVADGYPRADVLLEDFQYDNKAFLGGLERRGFTVPANVWANYPATIYSIASIAHMDYPIDEGSSVQRVRDLPYFRSIVRGDSNLIRSLRELGYTYVHFANGHDHLTLCGGTEDVCLKGNEGPDEMDVNLLRRTPVLAGMAWAKHWFGSGTKADALFSWRAFDAVQEKLPLIRETRSPFLLYAHIISPHPPFRYESNCQVRATSPDLKTWDARNKRAFVDQIQCANIQLEGLIDEIARTDPTAVIVLHGDHGSAFRQPFVGDPEHWSREQFIERMAPLAALKLPENCREQASRMGSLVNIFRVVIGCVSDRELPLLETKAFVTPYDNSPHFGKIHRYVLP